MSKRKLRIVNGMFVHKSGTEPKQKKRAKLISDVIPDLFCYRYARFVPSPAARLPFGLARLRGLAVAESDPKPARLTGCRINAAENRSSRERNFPYPARLETG